MAVVPDDELDFAPEDESGPERAEILLPAWKILIADDEPAVHAATRLALGSVSFRGREIEFVSAYSGAEVMQCLRLHDDIAVVFLDVVMETDDAGLRVARQLRKEGHHLPRIILRTGHPGYAPEREVIVDYDIHDYKEKTSLDFSKLFSCVISALRAYDDLLRIEQHKRGLLLVLESVSWFDLRSLRRYLSRMLAELSVLADIDIVDVSLAARDLPRRVGDNGADAMFDLIVDGIADRSRAAQAAAHIAQTFALAMARSDEAGSSFYARFSDKEIVLHSPQPDAFSRADAVLLEMFLMKVAQSLDNLDTFREVIAERDGLVRGFSLLDCGRECHHDDDELRQIQYFSRITAAKLQNRLEFQDEIDDWFVFSIATACGLHDLGQFDLPHEIFEKPGPLTEDERHLIRSHVEKGLALLDARCGGLHGTRLYPMLEAVIAQHHERYDGSGYPAGRKAAEISLAAGIVGLADTYVAMTSPRSYRAAISHDLTVAHLAANRGIAFDPRLVDAFLEALEDEASLV